MGPTRHSHLKMARVTPCTLYFCFRHDSSRVPITWNPRETRLKMAGVTPCIFGHISCSVSAFVLFFADFLCLCFCRPAFASAFVSYMEAARGRVRGESDCKHFSELLSLCPKTGCNYSCRELHLPLLLLPRRLLLLVLLPLCR